MMRRQRGFLLNPYRFGSGPARVEGKLMRAGRHIGAPMRSQRGFLLNPYRFGGAGGAAFSADAADFDGTNDYIARTTAFSPNAANSKSGILSFWFKPDAGTPVIFDTYASGFGFEGYIQIDWNLSVGNKFSLFLNSRTGPATVLWIESGSHAAGSWYNFLCSWDAAAGVRHLYINDVSDLAVVHLANNATVEYSEIDEWDIGDIHGNGFKVDGGLAEFYFAPGQFLDFSVAANRRKFISATGHPVDLGGTGSLPTGTAPLIYCHISSAETASNFALNRAGAGNFTVNGALTTYPSAP